MAKCLKWEVDKIYIYPYGGCTKFNSDLNKSIREELLILLFGPIFQIIGTFVLILFMNRNQEILIIINYSIFLLIFNLLPIYPLDGGKLVNLLFNKIISFRKSFVLSIISSFLVIIIIIFMCIKYNLKANFILVFIFLLVKLLDESKKRKYYYNKFILERYINNYHFKKYKNISNIKDMMRDKKHIFNINNRYITEREFLKKIYKK